MREERYGIVIRVISFIDHHYDNETADVFRLGKVAKVDFRSFPGKLFE